MEPTISVLPRTKEIYVAPDKLRIKKVWKFPVSLWAKLRYVVDNAEIIKKCFEFDWAANVKIPNKVKTEEDLNQCKRILGLRYKEIKNIYKHYASKSPIVDVWAMTDASFRAF